jgi:geranylgeranyl diphosphate synthase type I
MLYSRRDPACEVGPAWQAWKASSVTTFAERLDRLPAEIDEWMRPYVEPADGLVAPFYRMMGYHLGWAARDGTPLGQTATGKRVRPVLVVLTCEALAGRAASARGAAVAVELVHNFSLVHDDIQDQGEYRHGRETVWRVWGAPQAINVGDAIFALAQLALVRHAAGHPRLADAVGRLNETCLRLVEGQFLDLQLESTADVSVGLYERMIARKTAALIECACYLGGLMADADEASLAAVALFGHQLGIAFQYQDDVLGIWGDPSVTGKPSNTDIRGRKKGLPIVLALETATKETNQRLRRLLAGPEPLDDGQVFDVLGILDTLGIRARAQSLVDERFELVERALDQALPSGHGQELRSLCARLRVRET